MYEAFWGLREKPFENSPDPRFFYLSPQHRECCARLLYGVRERKPAVQLTGVFGCGKTAALQYLLSQLNSESYRHAYLANPRLSDAELLRMVCFHFGMSSVPEGKADALMALERLLVDNAREGRYSILIVDECHAIDDPSVFEELRLLLNLQWQERALFTLIISGQPELADRVNQLKPFEQRISLKSRLEGLSREECRAYAAHRLRVAGSADPEAVFDGEAIEALHESTGGIPRRINRIADLCLLAAMGSGQKRVGAASVLEEARALSV